MGTKKQHLNEVLKVILNDFQTLDLNKRKGDNKYYSNLIESNLKDLIELTERGKKK